VEHELASCQRKLQTVQAERNLLLVGDRVFLIPETIFEECTSSVLVQNPYSMDRVLYHVQEGRSGDLNGGNMGLQNVDNL